MTSDNLQFIDMHMHSIFSDGTLSPSEIVMTAKESNLYAIALTDHDTVDGLDEFMQAGKISGIGIETVSGIEISCNWNYREIHIVGLWINYKNQGLVSFLNNIVINRNKRNEIILNSLNDNGFKITMDELRNEAKGDIIGRLHIAALLVKKGYFSSIQGTFSSVLTYGAKCYSPRILPSVEEAITIIHSAGGLAIWAHAVHKNNKNNSQIKSDMLHFKQLGLDGIEGFYPEYSLNQQNLILKYAAELDLLVSGGSDFHGGNREGIKIGVGYGDLKVTVDLFFKLKEKVKSS